MNKERYLGLFMRDGSKPSDAERAALFYIFAHNDKLYRIVDHLYDFEENGINPECLDSDLDLTHSDRVLIKLAFNLYNGFESDTALNTFAALDSDNFDIAMDAIKLRFNRG